MQVLRFSIFSTLALLVASGGYAATIDDTAYYFVTTGQTGAQTQIDVNHTSTWDFYPNQDFLFGGGIFTLKDGPSTVADITLTVLNNDTGDRQSLTLDNTPFTQSFRSVNFLYPNPPEPITITAGDHWTVSLTSTAVDHQSTAYFIKGFDKGEFYLGGNTSTTPLTVPTTPGENTTATPEPASWQFMLGGAALFALLRLCGKRLKTAC